MSDTAIMSMVRQLSDLRRQVAEKDARIAELEQEVREYKDAAERLWAAVVKEARAEARDYLQRSKGRSED